MEIKDYSSEIEQLEQDRLELEKQAQKLKKEQENKTRINDAIKYAEKKLNDAISRQHSYNEYVKTVYDELVSKAKKEFKNDVTIEEIDYTHSFEPNTILYNPETDRHHINWVAEKPLKSTMKKLKLRYRGFNIDIESDFSGHISGMKLDYSITHRFQAYKSAKTVVRKIDEYILQQNRKNRSKNRKEAAVKAAVKYLQSISPGDAEIEVNQRARRRSYGAGYSTLDTVTVTFPKREDQDTANSVEYSVSYYDTDEPKEPFTLSVYSIFDSEYSALKKDPEKMINHLK